MTTHAPRAGRDRPPGPLFHATHDQREVHPMNAQIQLLQAVHADRLARLHAEARQGAPRAVRADRRAASSPRARAVSHPGRPADRRRDDRTGADHRARDAGRLPLMRGRPASPTLREDSQ